MATTRILLKGLTVASPPSSAFARVSRTRLQRELLLRGLDGKRFAHLVGIAPETLSRIMNGRSTTPDVFRRMAEALADTPIIAGAELLLGEEE